MLPDKSRESALSWNRLVELLEYIPATGIFINKTSGIRRIKGERAGHIKKDTGYELITIDSNVYRGHRLAWFYIHKKWPNSIIDHIDGNKSNNSITNLREATESKNKQNGKIQSNNTSGFKGVSFEKSSNRYKAYIRIDGRLKNLGRYSTAEEASEAYKLAAKKYFGEFYNEGTT